MTRTGLVAGLSSVALTMLALAGCTADAATPDAVDANAGQATEAPLPGSTPTSMTVGLVTADLTALNASVDLRLGPPAFAGLSANDVAAFLPSSVSLGGRTVKVNHTPFSPEDGINSPDTPIPAVCAAQANSAVVITDVAKPGLTDCLLNNGSIVIDASMTAWDTTALDQRSPRLWASAAPAADVAERVLLAQAEQRNLLSPGSAVVISGTDEVNQRVAEQVSVPALTTSGSTVTQLTEFPEDEFGTGYGTAIEELLKAAPGVVRPLSQLDYVVLAGFITQPVSGTSAPPVPTILVTSNNGISFSAFNSYVLRATQGLGWAPLRDTPNRDQDASPTSPEAAARCATSFPGINFDDDSTNAGSYLYRWCDAVNLLRLGAEPTGVLTSTSFRDAVWSAGTKWQPAAVFGNGWTPTSYAGANQARWIKDGINCPVTLDACFEYESDAISLP